MIKFVINSYNKKDGSEYIVIVTKLVNSLFLSGEITALRQLIESTRRSNAGKQETNGTDNNAVIIIESCSLILVATLASSRFSFLVSL